MPVGFGYTVRLVPTALTTALTIIQLKAGAANGFEIVNAKLYQVTKTSTELLRVGLPRKTAAATVTTAVSGTHIFKENPANPTTSLSLGTAATGVTASAEGTDGEIPAEGVWNVLNGEWIWTPGVARPIWVPAAGIIGLKLFTAPAASMTVGGEISIIEYP